MSKASGVRFLPWVGPRYSIGVKQGVRVLVLGESHYTRLKVDDSPELTRYVVQEHGVGDDRRAYFTQVAALLLGRRPISNDEKAKIWNSIAFYNFIQERVGPSARYRPTPEMWAHARRGLATVLAQCNPHLVIVTGLSLWSHLPEATPISTRYLKNGRTLGSRGFLANDGRRRVPAVGIRHPRGRGFDFDGAARLVRSALAAVRRERS